MENYCHDFGQALDGGEPSLHCAAQLWCVQESSGKAILYLASTNSFLQGKHTRFLDNLTIVNVILVIRTKRKPVFY